MQPINLDRYLMPQPISNCIATRLLITVFVFAYWGIVHPLTVFGQGYTPETAVKKMTVAEGLQVKLYANEPEVRQPILVKCDDRGRLWTIQYLQYPNPAGLKRVKVDRWSRTVYDRIPKPPPLGPKGADLITILSDKNGDGQADQAKHFVTGLNLATGLAFGHGGVYVIQVPYLLFYPDKNRDDVPDGPPKVLLKGFGMEDAQSLANHLTWGPDGWLYGVNGSTTTCRIRGIEFQQGCWRYHPLRDKFELFCEGGGNTFGLTFDDNGNLYYSTNGGPFVHAIQGAYYYKNFGKHGPLHNLYAYSFFPQLQRDQVPGGPPTGGTIYRGQSFPKPFHGTFIAGNFLGHTASWWQVKPKGITVTARYGGQLFNSRDSWFGPTDMCLGPDGSMFVCDFHDKRTAHPDPDANWDRSNGRIYKIESKEARPINSFDVRTKTAQELVTLLKHPNGWFVDRARVQLAERRDESTWPALKQMALQTEHSQWALRGLWALYVSEGFADAVAIQLLEHPYEYVRCWTVRLLGDDKHVSEKLAESLNRLAQSENSIVVLCQIAATAQRLSTNHSLPLIKSLLDRDVESIDPKIEWMIWWAIESHATSNKQQVVQLFAKSQYWNQSAYRGHLRRLIRRFAAEGTAESYAACNQMLKAVPQAHHGSAVQHLVRGLKERSRDLSAVTQGGLYEQFAQNTPSQYKQVRTFQPVDGLLKTYIKQLWNSKPTSKTLLELAIRAEIPEAYQQLISLIQAEDTPVNSRIMFLNLLQELGQSSSAQTALKFIDDKQPEKVIAAAIDVANRFGSADLTERLLSLYPSASTQLKSKIREVLFSRSASARRFLIFVDQQKIPVKEIPLDQLRRIALLNNDELNALVRKHWGNIGPGTPDEKLATMRRFNNDLRAGSGNRTNGRTLYKKHCGVCHTLFGEGNKIGPDLTKANRQDRNALLANIVDPSSVIRREYLSYVVVTTSGRVITGLLAEQDAASVTVLDAKNNRIRIPRDDVGILRESTTSLMPERILEQLKPQEIRDLFAYLQSKP